MIRVAVGDRINRTAPGYGFSIPAPTGGWNAYSPLPDMKPTDAVILDNWIPRPGWVEIRRGYVSYMANAPAVIQSLLVWRGSTTEELYAVTNGSIYLASLGGSFSGAVYSGLTTDRVQFVNFANDAGSFIICVNGVDTPFKYDGTTFATTVITGSSGSLTLDPKTLVTVVAHKSRLLFVEKDTLRVWFLAVEAIAGACGLLDLGPVFQKGGTLEALGTWSIDGGQGQDDYFVAISTQGELAIYQGDDPSDANNWALAGVFSLGVPLGRRSIFKFGGDLQVLTSTGVIALSQALNLDRAKQNDVAITAKIQNAWADVAQYKDNFGWQAIAYPLGQLAIYNIPIQELGTAYQYVQNLQNGSWCRFTGINALCWAICNDQIFFGGSDAMLNQWDQGVLDGTNDVTFDLQSAFNDFGKAGQLKHATMCRPLLNATPNAQPAMEILTDFASGLPTSVPTTIVMAGGDPSIRADWTSVAALGYYHSVRMRQILGLDPTLTSFLADGEGNHIIAIAGENIITAPVTPLNNVALQVINFDVIYEPGGQL